MQEQEQHLLLQTQLTTDNCVAAPASRHAVVIASTGPQRQGTRPALPVELNQMKRSLGMLPQTRQPLMPPAELRERSPLSLSHAQDSAQHSTATYQCTGGANPRSYHTGLRGCHVTTRNDWNTTGTRAKEKEEEKRRTLTPFTATTRPPDALCSK